jgi:hypothetical protein
MNNITAHLQVHKNQLAVDEFLRRFRNHFPNVKLYVHGDNGFDYSSLKEVYNFEYTHWDNSISPRAGEGIGLEGNISKWWAQQNYKVGHNEGLFMHNDWQKYGK